jgi:hypothetical protein
VAEGERDGEGGQEASGLAEGSHTLAAEFLADLHELWQWHGRELLDRLSDERPEVVSKLMVKLAMILHRRLGKPGDFDRRRVREEALQRLGSLSAA